MTVATVVVVPAYNEANRIDSAAFLAFMERERDTAILFVNDGSSDDTAAVLASMAQRNDRIRVLTLARNSGKAEAVRRGVIEAFKLRPVLVGYWDADLAAPLSGLAALRAELDGHAESELVMGSRVRLLGRTIERTAARHYLGRIFATVVSLMLGIPVYDTQCGAKLFRASPAMAACFSSPFTSRWIFDVELLARILRSMPASRGAIREVPLVEWRDVGGSKLTAGSFSRAPLELARIYLATRRPVDRADSVTGPPDVTT